MNTNLMQPQLLLPGFSKEIVAEIPKTNGEQNKISPKDRRFHDWYRFVLSFPPHLVREYCEDFGIKASHTLLDPFCGTGTTLVESKLWGNKSVGLEVNPFARFASSVKIDWTVNPDILEASSQEIAQSVFETLRTQGVDDNFLFAGDVEQLPLRTLAADTMKLLLKDSISPLPLHKVLVLLECLEASQQEASYKHALLALAKALVFTISNLKFGPEVGRRRETETGCSGSHGLVSGNS